MRVGFVGTENSHVRHFIRFLNVEERHPGYRAVALAGGDQEQNRELAEFGGIEVIVDAPEDLIGQVDAAIVCNRDGSLHRAAAEPLLRAGMPVLVDKPLAASVEDATAILDVAQETGSTMVSASALRFVPEMTLFPREHEQYGSLQRLEVSGPADPDSEYSGLFFYGIHHAETALEILGNPVLREGGLDVEARRLGEVVVADTEIDGVPVTFTFIVPDADGQAPFTARAVYDRGEVESELSLGPDYNAPALERFIAATEGGAPALSRDQLLSPVILLAAIDQALGAKA